MQIIRPGLAVRTRWKTYLTGGGPNIALSFVDKMVFAIKNDCYTGGQLNEIYYLL